jgi:hypothetical protein
MPAYCQNFDDIQDFLSLAPLALSALLVAMQNR